jgi:hypothetical protein
MFARRAVILFPYGSDVWTTTPLEGMVRVSHSREPMNIEKAGRFLGLLLMSARSGICTPSLSAFIQVPCDIHQEQCFRRRTPVPIRCKLHNVMCAMTPSARLSMCDHKSSEQCVSSYRNRPPSTCATSKWAWDRRPMLTPNGSRAASRMYTSVDRKSLLFYFVSSPCIALWHGV